MSTFTDIQVFPVNAVGKLKANGKVTVAGTIRVDFKVMEGSKGMFATFHSQKGKGKDGNDAWFPTASLLDDSTKQEFNDAILAAYNARINGGESPAPSTPASKPATKKLAPF